MPIITEEALPVIPDEVTSQWLSKRLGRPVKDIIVTNSTHATTSMLFATLFYDDNRTEEDRPFYVCIKGGFNPERLARHPWIVTIYHREADFFDKVAPLLGANLKTPRCWWAGNSPSNGIIVMDDLAKTGHTFGDPEKTWSVAAVLAGVEQLAVLHAGTWGAKPEDFPWITPHYDQAILALMSTYKDTVTAPGRPVIPDYMKDQGRVTEALKAHFSSRNPRYQCILHGDPHTGNTFISKDGEPGFLDWQMIHIGSPFHDVAYFVGSALAIDDRRNHEGEVLDHYLDILAKLGRPRLSRNEVMQEYSKSFLGGIGWIMCPFDWQKKERVYAMAERYVAAIEDHNVFGLLEQSLIKGE